jgi:predicted short-subunit dehydrogenase-like oxidoreductase (DUF2520 family)
MRISFLGSGKIAFHLIQQFNKSEIEIVDIYSRNTKTAEDLAILVEANVVDDLNKLSTQVDAFFICVPDAVISKISEQLPKSIPQIHCSGIKDMESLSSKTKGVFYPLQTFSPQKEIDFSKLKIYTEANDVDFEEELRKLANHIGSRSESINSEQRQKIHLSAVFACNFVNHCWQISEEILAQNSLSKEILFPLIQETFDKFKAYPAKEVQTGPAVRGDQSTIKKHKELLKEENEKYISLYKGLTESIKNSHEKL